MSLRGPSKEEHFKSVPYCMGFTHHQTTARTNFNEINVGPSRSNESDGNLNVLVCPVLLINMD